MKAVYTLRFSLANGDQGEAQGAFNERRSIWVAQALLCRKPDIIHIAVYLGTRVRWQMSREDWNECC